MKKILISLFVVLIVATSFGQTIDELLKIADNISALEYAQSLSSISGLTGFDSNLSGGLSFPESLSAGATATFEVSKNLKFGVGLSNDGFSVFGSFDPGAYDRASQKILFENLSKRMKLRIEVVDIFFDALKTSRMIENLSSEATSLKVQTETELLKSQYSYDVSMVNALLGLKISKFDFPTLDVPKIPDSYTPYNGMKKPSDDSGTDFGGSVNFSNSISLSLSFNYDWRSSTSQNSPNVIDVQKKKYFDDMNVLSVAVKAYDKRLAALFNDYSNLYGSYLNGKTSLQDVDKVSSRINRLGYERDLYCIELLKDFYLYKTIGE